MNTTWIVVWGTAFLVGMVALGLIGARFFASLHNWGYSKGYVDGWQQGVESVLYPMEMEQGHELL